MGRPQACWALLQEQLGCQEPSIKQLLAMTSGILPSDNMNCGTANSSWTADDWYWQYRCSTPFALNPHVANACMPRFAHAEFKRLLVVHTPLSDAAFQLKRTTGCSPLCMLHTSSACSAMHVSG